jgi:hypothetical protein
MALIISHAGERYVAKPLILIAKKAVNEISGQVGRVRESV